jgi:hypothetical protein
MDQPHEMAAAPTKAMNAQAALNRMRFLLESTKTASSISP